MKRLRMNERITDRVAAIIIQIGGVAVVALVAAIVVGIAVGALPLFSGATLGPVTVSTLPGSPAAVGWNPRVGQPWYLDSGGTVMGGGGDALCRVEDLESPILRAARSPGGVVALLDHGGLVHVGGVRFEDRGSDSTEVSPAARWVSLTGPLALDDGVRWTGLAVNTANDGGVFAIVWSEKRIFGARWLADLERWEEHALPAIYGVRAGDVGEGLETAALVSRDGALTILDLPDGTRELLDEPLSMVTQASFLVGGRSLVAATAGGEVQVLQRLRRVRVSNRSPRDVRVAASVIPVGMAKIVPDDDVGRRLAHVPGIEIAPADSVWQVVRRLPSLDAEPTCIAPGPRDRSFAVAGADGAVALYHGTTGARRILTRWPIAPVTAIVLADSGDALVAAGPHVVAGARLENPHPEISLKTLLLPVRYEGYATPRLIWQTSGGSDAFERKLSVTPLIFGTLKATLYAMLVSVPLALLAAVYVSQFAPSWLQSTVKPSVELMAAVPSVVVGFLAALWLAPRLEVVLLRAVLAVIALPLVVLASVAIWRLLPATWRRRAPAGIELAILFLVGAVVIGGASTIADTLELRLFDGDLIRWLFTEWGLRYDQRNALVVGVALGFAVIPVIFTIAEDACSAVPRSLTRTARSLGATRWQAAVRMVVPAASPGLVAAVILGFGRAVGETMIVLMVSGNTPLLDLDPFTGMRTMAATIAVEIPEAAVSGTLYRTLFLTGLLLFVFTFCITTVADMVGRALRRRYAQF